MNNSHSGNWQSIVSNRLINELNIFVTLVMRHVTNKLIN